jgi:hypothetical protein
MKSLHLLALSSLLCAGLVLAQTTPTTGSKTTTPAAPAKTAAPKTPAAAPPSSADIASAKAKGMVWVNLNTKVYHKSGDKEFGTTKNGKFMSEADAKAAGARIAKN